MNTTTMENRSIAIIIEVGPKKAITGFSITGSNNYESYKALEKVPFTNQGNQPALLQCPSCLDCRGINVFIKPDDSKLVKSEPDQNPHEIIFASVLSEEIQPSAVKEEEETEFVYLEDEKCNIDDDDPDSNDYKPGSSSTSSDKFSQYYEDVDKRNVRCLKCDTVVCRSETKEHPAYCPKQLVCYMCHRDDFKKTISLRTHERYCDGTVKTGEPICKYCGKIFTKHFILKQHINVIHKNIKPHSCLICPGISFGNKQSLQYHMDQHDKGLLTFKCDYCSARFAKKLGLKKHVSAEHKADFQCMDCDPPKGFLSQKSLAVHRSNCHTFEKAIVSEKLQCKKCLCYFQEHRKQEHDKKCIGKLVCQHCSRQGFTSKWQWRTHERYCKSSACEPVCAQCDKRFESLAQLKRHEVSKHNEQYLRCCEQCGKKVSKKEFERHCLKHTDNPKPYQCDICKKKYTVKVLLRKHIMLKHLDSFAGMAWCNDCNPPRKFLSQKEVDKHKKIHHESQGYPCPECGKVFKTDNLKPHMLAFHTTAEQKRYHQWQCDFPGCNFRSVVKSSFLTHKNQHLPESEKPFRCKYCNKGFPLQVNLDRHEMIHTNIRPFNCEVCGKAFLYKASLSTHMRLHTGEKPYECEVCHQRFADRGCYRSHILGHEKQLNIKLSTSVKKFDKRYTVPISGVANSG